MLQGGRAAEAGEVVGLRPHPVLPADLSEAAGSIGVWFVPDCCSLICPTMTTICYVLTTTGRDRHAEMTRVSAISFRLSNPGGRILLVADSESLAALQAVSHDLLNWIDCKIPVQGPPGTPEYRNRWIKTQLPRLVDGDAVFLDSDTIIRRPLGSVLSRDASFGGVTNHNGVTLEEQVWEEDARAFERIGWPRTFSSYINGGFWAYRAGPEVDRLFELWHRYWSQGFELTGRSRDQPALNLALMESGIRLEVLPRCFNEQLAMSWEYTSGAVIWHFYGQFGRIPNRYEDLIQASPEMDGVGLQREVRRLIRQPAPWRNQDLLARLLGPTQRGRRLDPGAVQFWLDGDRGRSLECAMKSLRLRLGLRG